jgi:hypothetical protein
MKSRTRQDTASVAGFFGAFPGMTVGFATFR